jgi:hypothetical protein
VTTGEEPRELDDEQVTYYLDVMITHGSVFGASICGICGVACCPAWVDAHDKLVAAHVAVEPW